MSNGTKIRDIAGFNTFYALQCSGMKDLFFETSVYVNRNIVYVRVILINTVISFDVLSNN